MSTRRPVVTVVTSLYILLLLLLGVAMVMTTTAADSNGFDLDSYCAIECLKGRGGRACHCNSAKFAGKRRPQAVPMSTFDDSTRRLALTLPDVTSRLRTARSHRDAAW